MTTHTDPTRIVLDTPAGTLILQAQSATRIHIGTDRTLTGPATFHGVGYWLSAPLELVDGVWERQRDRNGRPDRQALYLSRATPKARGSFVFDATSAAYDAALALVLREVQIAVAWHPELLDAGALAAAERRLRKADDAYGAAYAALEEATAERNAADAALLALRHVAPLV